MKEFFQHFAQFINRRYYLLSLCVTLFAAGLVFGDAQQHYLEAAVPFKMIRGIGKAAGSVAIFLAIVSMSYYGIRDAYVISRRFKVNLPPVADEWVKYVINLLRLVHPFLGTIVFAAVLLHGYVMWRVWSGGSFDFSVESGLVAAALLVVLVFSGLIIRWMPKMLKLRHVHRLVGGTFLLSFFIHKIFR